MTPLLRRSLPWLLAALVVVALLGGSWYLGYRAAVLATDDLERAVRFQDLVTFSSLSNRAAAGLGALLLLAAGVTHRWSHSWAGALALSGLAVLTAWASLWAKLDQYAIARGLPALWALAALVAWRAGKPTLVRASLGLVAVAGVTLGVHYWAWKAFERVEQPAILGSDAPPTRYDKQPRQPHDGAQEQLYG